MLKVLEGIENENQTIENIVKNKYKKRVSSDRNSRREGLSWSAFGKSSKKSLRIVCSTSHHFWSRNYRATCKAVNQLQSHNEP